VKVLGVRSDDDLALTVAMPLDCLAIASESAYFTRKAEVVEALARRFRSSPFALDWRLNCLDHPGRGSAGAYLTLTGTSAEDGDSGQVGRGNRANGLIAFARPSGGEATAGKNPVAHAGKIYSVLSHRLAALVHEKCPDLLEVYVHLAVRIGEPVDRPWVGVQAVTPRGANLGDFEPAIREVIDAELARMAEFRAELIRGEHRVC
jgi:S-adenosylmethionine synthetase